jgi:hypothetical protein
MYSDGGCSIQSIESQRGIYKEYILYPLLERIRLFKRSAISQYERAVSILWKRTPLSE